jgi:hypothetical protein
MYIKSAINFDISQNALRSSNSRKKLEVIGLVQEKEDSSQEASPSRNIILQGTR